ncbi:MAG TPA: L-seryl-tRNA(Sec) selenium transferase [Bryobacteraceae bacterium]|nr:L-seryl-tRNA(Sec) selenium transferase [Bryobacteraceae bacterium]
MSVEGPPRSSELPSVEDLLRRLDAACPRELLANETRRVIEQARSSMRRGEPVEVASIPTRILQSLASLEKPSLRRVINATGIILHASLGRAPLQPVFDGGYSNLQLDLTSGKRIKRDLHVRDLIERLTGYPGMVVNNNAAAMWLVLHELAGGGEVIVSRGELIELGDGLRVPEIIHRSGALIREVGTTNRTRLDDYRSAINSDTRVILRVNPSNFQVTGFASRPEIGPLAELAREHGIPLYENVGSGCLVDMQAWGLKEPVVADSLQRGANLVSFSGDKLLGGPQAGLITGDSALIARLRRNPMYRLLRCDKLVYSALEGTLRSFLFCRFASIPAIAMIAISAETVRRRTEGFVARLGAGEVIPGLSRVGANATPAQVLPTWLAAFDGEPEEFERQLRASDPPVIARVDDGRLVIDLRTVFEHEEDMLASALRSALTNATRA